MEELDYEFLSNQINRLKRKCNLQIDKIISLENQVKSLENERNTLLQKLEKNLKVCNENKPSEEQNFFSGFLDRIKIAFQVFQEVYKNVEFIPYKNNSKNSLEFYKVEKGAFDGILGKFADEKNSKIILQFCADFGLFKIDKNGSYTFRSVQADAGSSCRIYMIRRAAMDYIAGLEAR